MNEEDCSSKRAERTLYTVSVVAIFFTLCEILGGYFANSLAIMTDAGHLATDLFGFIISIVAIKFSRIKSGDNYSFGFHRSEVIGAFLSIFTIWTLTVILIYLAIGRIVNNDFEIDANVMLITAGIGIIVNIIMGIVLLLGNGNHSHFGMAHEHTHKNSQQSNINVRAAFIHVVGDFVQSIGVFIAALIIKFTDFHLADPLCTFLFSVLVLATTGNVLRDVFRMLMEGSPRHIRIDEVKAEIRLINGVQSITSLHLWSLSIEKTCASVHLITEPLHDSNKITKEVNELLRVKFKIFYSTIQVESSSDKINLIVESEEPS